MNENILYVEHPNNIITQTPSLSSLHLAILTSPMWSQYEHTKCVSALIGNKADMALIKIIFVVVGLGSVDVGSGHSHG